MCRIKAFSIAILIVLCLCSCGTGQDNTTLDTKEPVSGEGGYTLDSSIKDNYEKTHTAENNYDMTKMQKLQRLISELNEKTNEYRGKD